MTIEETHVILTKELADLEYLLASDTLADNESLVIKSQIMNLRNRLSRITLPSSHDNPCGEVSLGTPQLCSLPAPDPEPEPKLSYVIDTALLYSLFTDKDELSIQLYSTIDGPVAFSLHGKEFTLKLDTDTRKFQFDANTIYAPVLIRIDRDYRIGTWVDITHIKVVRYSNAITRQTSFNYPRLKVGKKYKTTNYINPKTKIVDKYFNLDTFHWYYKYTDTNDKYNNTIKSDWISECKLIKMLILDK